MVWTQVLVLKLAKIYAMDLASLSRTIERGLFVGDIPYVMFNQQTDQTCSCINSCSHPRPQRRRHPLLHQILLQPHHQAHLLLRHLLLHHLHHLNLRLLQYHMHHSIDWEVMVTSTHGSWRQTCVEHTGRDCSFRPMLTKSRQCTNPLESINTNNAFGQASALRQLKKAW